MYFLWYSWTETCVFLLRCSINGLTSKLLRLPIFMYIIIAYVSAFSCLKDHKCRRSRETILFFILVSVALLFIWAKTCITFVEVFHGLLTGKICVALVMMVYSGHVRIHCISELDIFPSLWVPSWKEACGGLFFGGKSAFVILWVKVQQSMKAGYVLWLKFLVLISFPCFAGFFDHLKLIPRNTITLRIIPATNINLGKKSKLDRLPIQGIKWKIGGRSVHHPPPHPLLLESL